MPVEPAAELVERLRAELPELPGARIRRFEQEYELSFYDADVLNSSVALRGSLRALSRPAWTPRPRRTC